MPLWYTSIVEEHNAVRNSAGIFDVSHMGRYAMRGEDATRFLNYILPSNAEKVKHNRAFYSTLCAESGGIIDDVVTNKFSDTEYLMVVNAANRAKDMKWLREHLDSMKVEITDESDTSALIAIQGPLASSLLQKICDCDLASIRRFGLVTCKVSETPCVVSRTGYTGEDGFEITVLETSVDRPIRAEMIWDKLLELGKNQGVKPCGLGARDSLRLEAGMCLYGNDIDETTSPVEAALESVVSREKTQAYVGREMIETQLREGTTRRRAAFSMVSTGIPRHGQEIRFSGSEVGRVTSGTFSPTLKNGIGMGYVKTPLSSIGQNLWVRIRDADQSASVVSTPFFDATKFGYKRTFEKIR